MLQATALVSSTVGPVLMGRIFDVRGEYALAIQIFIFVTALGLPLAFMVKPLASVDSRVPTKL